MEAFVYCWTDHKTNKLYIGSHKGSLDDGYVCSSKTVMEQYKNRPSDFTRQIIAEGTINDIRMLECKILKSLNAAKDDQFYNKHNGDGKFICLGHSEKTRKKMSRTHKEKIIPSEQREKMRLWHVGRKRSEETRRKMRDNNTKSWLGKTHLEDTKNKMRKKKPDYFTTPKGKFWWTNGTNITLNKECPGDGWIKGKKINVIG